MEWYRYRFKRESGKSGAVPATVSADDRRMSHCEETSWEGWAGRVKREPGDLPSIVKRHFLRGLRGGSERDTVRLPSVLED